MVLYPLNTMQGLSTGISPITEWQPLQFSDGRSFAFLGILGCIFLLVIVRRTELLWQELVVLAVGAWLAASHRRMLFVFGIWRTYSVAAAFRYLGRLQRRAGPPVAQCGAHRRIPAGRVRGLSNSPEPRNTGGGVQPGKSGGVHQNPPSLRANAQ